MKKIITILILFTNFSFIFSQALDCPDYPNPDAIQPPLNIYSRSVLVPPPSSNKYVFNIKFHIVKNSDGTGVTANYGENEVMNAIMILNTHYNPFNVYFKYRGFDVIQSTSNMKIRSFVGGALNQNTAHPTFAELVQFSKTGLSTPVYDNFAMNLFIVEGIDFSTTTNQPATAGVANRPGVNSVFAFNTLLTSTMPHEIGHNFNLLHTHQGSGAADCELVNGTNSDTTGDLVRDTPAFHVLSASNINTSNCSYQNTSNLTDCSGVLYMNVPIKNFMSTNNSCRILSADYLPGNAVFSQGQANRMREIIDTYYNNVNNFYGYKNAKTTVESLYEPYEQIPIMSNVIASITDDGIPNGLSTVCRYFSGYTFKYQKGFNYIFNRYGVTTNNTVSQLPSYEDYGTFKITQLDPNYSQPFGQVCYRGAQICKLEPMAGGKVFTTHNLGSSLFTETNLTPQQLENPDLINNLPSETYNIIVKETSTGEIKTETIYKRN